MKRVHAAFMAGMALAFAPAIAGTVHLDKSMCHVAPAPLTRRLRLQFGSGGSVDHWASRRGPGWTWPQVKRMARKRRNVQRHRQAQRRAR